MQIFGIGQHSCMFKNTPFVSLNDVKFSVFRTSHVHLLLRLDYSATRISTDSGMSDNELEDTDSILTFDLTIDAKQGDMSSSLKVSHKDMSICELRDDMSLRRIL